MEACREDWARDAKQSERTYLATVSSCARSEEWRKVGLKAQAVSGTDAAFQMVMFVECGMGCDQHGGRDAATGATVCPPA